MQKSHELLEKAARNFLASDRQIKKWIDKIPLLKWPLQNPMTGDAAAEKESLIFYFALMRAVIFQQLSTKAATTLLERFKKISGGSLPMPADLLALEAEKLRACGLSAQKVRALRIIAEKASENYFPSREEALGMAEETLRTLLTSLSGIGDWSADMVLIFALHHPDIFAVSDYGVREGYRLIYQLEKQPSARMLAKFKAKFSPYGSFMTGYCWAVKEFIKNQEI